MKTTQEWLKNRLYPAAPKAMYVKPKHIIFFQGLIMGGVDSSYRAVATNELFVPGLTCAKTLTAMPVKMADPFLAFDDVGSFIVICGTPDLLLICIKYMTATNTYDAEYATYK